MMNLKLLHGIFYHIIPNQLQDSALELTALRGHQRCEGQEGNHPQKGLLYLTLAYLIIMIIDKCFMIITVAMQNMGINYKKLKC